MSDTACTMPTDEVVVAAQKVDAALEADDVVLAGTLWRQLQPKLKCLDGPMPAAVWADLLVDLALLEHAAGTPAWSQPLQVATEIRPDVRRDIGPAEFRAFVPTRPPDDGAPLPTDATYWLDGRRISNEPTLVGGPHVVQQEREGAWITLVLRDEPFPDYWRTPEAMPPIAEDERDAGGTTVGAVVWAVGGGSGSGQQLDVPLAGVTTGSQVGALVGAGTHGRVQAGLAGGFWELTGGLRPGGSVAASGSAGVALGGEKVAVLVGAGLGLLTIDQEDPQTALLPRPHLGLGAAVPVGGWALRGAVGGGWTPASTEASGWVALAPASKVGAAFGLDGGVASARFAQAEGAGELDASRWWLGAAVGVGIGR